MSSQTGIGSWIRARCGRGGGPWGAAVVTAMLALLSGCAGAARVAPDAPATPVAGADAPAAATGAPAASAASPISAALAVETFDSAWSRIHATYYDSTFGGLDWHGVRAELRPRARAAESVAELRSVIRTLLGRMGDSHFVLLPAEVADAVVTEDGVAPWGDVGIELRWVEEAVTVTRVDPRGAAAAAGVRPGWLLESVDGRELAVSASLEALHAVDEVGSARSLQLRMLGAALAALAGEPGERVSVVFRDAADEPVALDLVRRSPRGEPIRLGNLPVIHAQVEGTEVPLRAGGCAGLVRFNAWVLPLTARIHSAVDEAAHCAGIIIDLRGNVGGVLGMLSGISGAFLDEPARLGTMRTRTHELRITANPRRATLDGRRTEPFGRRLAILVDDWTLSAAELFAAGMQGIGRARVFGIATAGEALPAHVMRLPTGDVMMYAIADFEGPDGRRIEGPGVIPDVHVPYSRSGLLADRDLALEAALEWIGSGRSAAPQQ